MTMTKYVVDGGGGDKRENNGPNAISVLAW